MTLLEMCNESSISAYDKEIERQKSLNTKTDMLFKWLTLLTAVFNLLIPFMVKSNEDTSDDPILFYTYIGMMLFFGGAFVTILFINCPMKRKLPSLGSDSLKRIQKKLEEEHLDFDDAYREALYKEMLETDVITQALRSYNQRIAVAIMVAEVFMGLGLAVASVALGFSLWKG